MIDRNCLSYWFPKLDEAGLPVPRTEIVRTDVDLSTLCDGKTPPGWSKFLAELDAAVSMIGGQPCFLRTGQGSGKHDWEKTCYLGPEESLGEHVGELVYWSHLVDFLGLSHDVWVARELLPVVPLAVLPRYSNMPLVMECRCFVAGGKIQCEHPYWPVGAIREGLDCTHADEPDECGHCHLRASALFDLANPLYYPDRDGWRSLAEEVARVFADDGAWSVDLLATKKGWFVTDMAEANRSFHYPECTANRTEG